VRKLSLALVAAAVVLAVAAPVHALDCAGDALDDGCLFTITGGDTPDPDDGYLVTNVGGVPMWDFVRDRDLQAIGFPISQRWTDGPFTLQAFQKVILQWDSGKHRMNYYNTLDALANRYPEVELPFVPSHQVLEADRGADFGTITRNHLAILDQNPAIKRRFLSEPDWLNLYGLPIRYAELEVAGNPQGVQMLRAQRTVFVIWNVPAAGITVGRVNLQNVPDKLKKLSDVVIPDAAKVLTYPPDPALSPAIRSISWIADGIAAGDRESVALLRRLYSASPELFSRLVFERQTAWVHQPPTPQTEAALGVLLAIADIPWTRKHVSATEPLIMRVLLATPQADWPAAFQKLLHKPWMRDGVTWDELQLVDHFLYFTLNHPRYPGTTYFGKTEEVNQILSLMLDMPFLDTFEGYETHIIQDFPKEIAFTARPGRPGGTYGGLEHTQTALQEFLATGGITDAQALAYRYVGTSLRDFLSAPGDVPHLLNGWSRDFAVKRRTVYIPSAGFVKLFFVHHLSQTVDPDAMDILESVLHEVAEFVEVPFPHGYLVLKTDAALGRGDNLGHSIEIDYQYIRNRSITTDTRRILSHIIAHYWQTGDRLVDEGAATVVEYGLGYRDSYTLPESGSPHFQAGERPPCAFDSISDATSDAYGSCDYYFGPRLFVELYQELDAESFHKGFAQLVNMRYGNLHGSCYPERETIAAPCPAVQRAPYLEAIAEAFTTDTSSEAAATARAVIERWR